MLEDTIFVKDLELDSPEITTLWISRPKINTFDLLLKALISYPIYRTV